MLTIRCHACQNTFEIPGEGDYACAHCKQLNRWAPSGGNPQEKKKHVSEKESIEIKEFRGRNGTLVLTDTGVIIKRGIKGFLLGGGMLRGDKTIPYSSIVAVQLKKAGLLAGYIQLSLKGGSEAKNGLLESVKDENSVTFGGKTKEFEEAKRLIEEKISVASRPTAPNYLSELEKLADLKVKGIVSEEEFATKKKQILGL